MTDAENNPLPGATIQIPELGIGTMADADGNYTTCTGSARGLDQEGAELMGRNIWFVWNLDDVSDGTIDPFESNLIRRLSGLLYITDKMAGEILKKYR